MARTSCLVRPTNDRFFVIRSHRMKTFRDNESICKLISFFDFKTTSAIAKEYGEYDDVPEDTCPWVECSLREISLELLNTLSKPTICESLEIMEFLKIIEKQEATGRKNRYRLNVPLLNKWCREKYVVSEEDLTCKKTDKLDTCKISDRYVSNSLQVPVKNLPGDLSNSLQVDGVYIGRGLSYRTDDEKGPPELFSLSGYPENQTPTPPETSSIPEDTSGVEALTPCSAPAADFETQSTSPSQSDLQLEDDVMLFTKNAYKRIRGIRLRDSALKPVEDQIRRTEEDLSREEFRFALCQYLDTSDNEWLHKNEWPIRQFLKSPLDYLPSTASFKPQRPASSLRAPERSLGSSSHSAMRPEAISENQPAADPEAHFTPVIDIPIIRKQDPCLTYVDEWNRLNPSRNALPLLQDTRKLLERAIEHPDFIPNFTKVCELSGKLIANGQDTKFSWLFLGYGVQNWSALLQGKWDFLMKGKTSTQGDVSERLIERLEREEREGNGHDNS